MNKSQLRIALLGAGKMGMNHVRAIRGVPGASLVAVHDPGLKADGAWSFGEGVRLYGSASELLTDARPDIVHVCTPPSSHVDLARLALSSGAHVYIEKPVALRVDEVRDLLSHAEHQQRLVCAGHQCLFEDPALKLIKMLPSIGRVVHVESYYSFRKVRRNLSFVEQAIDILPHPVYLLVDLMNRTSPDDPIEVEYSQASVEGEVRATLRAGNVSGSLVVSLQGRPVDHYLKVVGTNGALIADFVRGAFIRLDGPGAGFLPSLTIPFRHSRQMFWGGVRGVAGRISRGGSGYPGLDKLVGDFYDRVRSGRASPTPQSGIEGTVAVCEVVGRQLQASAADQYKRDLLELERAEAAIAPLSPSAEVVLLTGASGFLGRKAAEDLVASGRRVRALVRRLPVPRNRVAGVTYHVADLAIEIPPELFKDVAAVVHCAATTEGGLAEHEKGTIVASRNLAEAAAQAGVRKFVYISSLAVLKPGGRRRAEGAPVDTGNLARGPYVWAKAEAEKLIREMSESGRLAAKIIRPGPIVDYQEFDPPGRLGRDLGSMFVAVGPKAGLMSVVQVSTVSSMILHCLEDFEAVPSIVNLVEADAPSRSDLIGKLRARRPELAIFWLPAIVVRVLSPVAMLAQRLLLGAKDPINLASAFASEAYDTTLARRLIGQARGQAKTERR